jgi:hypothetical protein
MQTTNNIVTELVAKIIKNYPSAAIDYFAILFNLLNFACIKVDRNHPYTTGYNESPATFP